jgi:ubiquitin C-terminal hydrolase
MTVDTESCKHQPVYFGVININIDERTVGSVDVWRCGICKKKFCEEKQLGIEAIADIVGMPKIESDEKWAVSVCKFQKGKDKWKLVRLKENSELKHECLDEKIIELPVKDYKIDDERHWSFLIDDNINQAVEI